MAKKARPAAPDRPLGPLVERKSGRKLKRTTMLIDPSVYENFRVYCERRGRQMSWLIERLLVIFLRERGMRRGMEHLPVTAGDDPELELFANEADMEDLLRESNLDPKDGLQPVLR